MTFSFWNWKKKKRGEVVLGKELAAATQREKQRTENGKHSPSPFPNFAYSNWPEEQSLLNPVRNELDNKIVALINEFEAVDDSAKENLRNSISQDDIYTLLEFIRRTILFGVRNQDKSDINKCIVAIAMIEAERCDYRDVLVALSFFFFGIHQLNLDDTVFLNRSKQLAQGRTKQLIEQFQQRPTGSKTIEAFGYTAIQTGYGISFIQTMTARYNAKKNLINVLISFGNDLTSDKYRKAVVTLERTIPPVWLRAQGDQEIENLLSKTTGCVSLKASLKPEYHPKADMQSLYIYLAEYSDVESPKILMQKAIATPHKEFAQLAISEDKIFCLIIQRAIMVGVKEYETNKSLCRFEMPLKELIKRS